MNNVIKLKTGNRGFSKWFAKIFGPTKCELCGLRPAEVVELHPLEAGLNICLICASKDEK